MNDQTQDPTWLTGLIKKRTPAVLLVLSQLVEAGLSKGHCSANDVTTRDLPEPNVIGATFKTLKQLGFRQLDKRIEPRFKSQHGRKVFVWELEQAWKAKAFLTQVRSALTKVGQFESQGELF